MTIPVYYDVQWVVLAAMIATFEALLVFLLFLPGFMSQRIVELLTPLRKRGTMERVIDGAALSILVYLLYLAVASIFQLPILPISVGEDRVISADGRSVAAILMLSLVVGLLVGKSLEFGTLFRILRGEYIKLPDRENTRRGARMRRRLRALMTFTRSTGRSTVWEDVLSRPSAPIMVVGLKDGSRVVGRCRFFSDDPDRQEILVWPVDIPVESGPEEESALRGISLIDKSGNATKLPGEGLYLGPASEIAFIEFLGSSDVD